MSVEYFCSGDCVVSFSLPTRFLLCAPFSAVFCCFLELCLGVDEDVFV